EMPGSPSRSQPEVDPECVGGALAGRADDTAVDASHECREWRLALDTNGLDAIARERDRGEWPVQTRGQQGERDVLGHEVEQRPGSDLGAKTDVTEASATPHQLLQSGREVWSGRDVHDQRHEGPIDPGFQA